jgi:hypothetical protein
VTAAERERELEQQLERGINDVRLLLLNRALTGERRKALREELLALRLARAGIEAKDQYAYLRRHGVYRRRPRLTRGPEVWGDRVSAHVR